MGSRGGTSLFLEEQEERDGDGEGSVVKVKSRLERQKEKQLKPDLFPWAGGRRIPLDLFLLSCLLQSQEINVGLNENRLVPEVDNGAGLGHPGDFTAARSSGIQPGSASPALQVPAHGLDFVSIPSRQRWWQFPSLILDLSPMDPMG